jgi:hypothetical protein
MKFSIVGLIWCFLCAVIRPLVNFIMHYPLCYGRIKTYF